MGRGFRATLDLIGGNRKKSKISELSTDTYVTGAYRTNKEDVFGFSALDPPQPKPSNQIPPSLRPSKSTSNLVQPVTADPNLRKSTPAISSDPRGAEQGDRSSTFSIKDIKLREKEQKKLEKQRQAEQKKQAQAQAKQEKLMRERAKKEAQIAAKAGKQKKTTDKTTSSTTSPPPPPMPQPQSQPRTQPQDRPKTLDLPKTTPKAQPRSSPTTAYSTNTIESSISRSSGPPPYSEKTSKENITLSKPVDTGSWDIISQHREQINRPTASSSIDSKRKQVVMDLNYKFGSSDGKNSEAGYCKIERQFEKLFHVMIIYR